MKQVMLAYCAVLAIGLVAMIVRQDDTAGGWRAARDMKANHLIVPGDLVPANGGRYLRRDVKKGEPLQPDDLADRPDLSLPAGRVALALPIEPRQVDVAGINAGSVVRLCQAAASIVEGLTVRAVICSQDRACVAVAAMPSKPAAEIAKAFATQAVSVEPMRDPACK